MTSMKQWIAAAAATLACTTAGAGMHQICFEGPRQSQSGQVVYTGIFGCAQDAPGTCTITPFNPYTPSNWGFSPRIPPTPLNQSVTSAGTFAYFNLNHALTQYTAKVEYFDTNAVKIGERLCTVNVVYGNAPPVGSATAGAVLTGFSTDVSGQVTTGVWKLESPLEMRNSTVTLKLPADFIVVGGGAMGVEGPNGAVIVRSMRSPSDPRVWEARTSDAGGLAQLHKTTAYAIGMRIEGVSAARLESLIGKVRVTSAGILAWPSTQVSTAISGAPVLSGGIAASADISNAPTDLLGQYATATAPVIGTVRRCSTGIRKCFDVQAPTGWHVESKDHIVAHPGNVQVELLSMPPTLTLANGTTWEVRSGFVTATSPRVAHPAIDIAGLRGQYALTGVGAIADWLRFDLLSGQSTFGNLLWKLEPRADLGGASLASKDHILSSPAALIGYALGIQLVPPGSP